VVWGKLCDVCEKYLKKGNEIDVDGKLTSRNWQDKDGNKHYATEIVVNELLMLGSNGKGN
jgi:single-strand DNA-binding protein